MIIFNTDLDNTIIYSYKHDIGEQKMCAEIYQGREISFVTNKTAQLLKEVNSRVVFVPTTTRTIEQYRRIDLGFGVPEYALVCNGGVLLRNGEEDEAWYKESYESVLDCQKLLSEAEGILEKDSNRIFEIRNIRSLFVFTKCNEPINTVNVLKSRLDPDLIDVFNNGVKVYAVPKALSKGTAVKRLKKLIGAEYNVSAGDSEFDVSMLRSSDKAIAPRELAQTEQLPKDTIIFDGKGIFSEFVLENILRISADFGVYN